MQADKAEVNQKIQEVLAKEWTTLCIGFYHRLPRFGRPTPSLTANDARCMVEYLRNTPRIHTLDIHRYCLHDAAALIVFCNGLPMCTSITKVILRYNNLTNEELERLLPAFYNTSVRILHLYGNMIQGQRGGEVLRDLLVGNDTIAELSLFANHIGPEGAGILGQGLVRNNHLRKLILASCHIGNDGLEHLVAAMGEAINNSLTDLNLSDNGIHDAEGGRQVGLLLQCFPKLKDLNLCGNPIGPLGARALAPDIAAAHCLESLNLEFCPLGNDGIVCLVADGHVNRSLTTLRLHENNISRDVAGQESVLSLASRCTNLDVVYGIHLSPDQVETYRRLLDRKRLCTKASALAGSPFSILYRFVVDEAHSHEYGLSAIFIILQNDGDDYFCNANNRDSEHYVYI